MKRLFGLTLCAAWCLGQTHVEGPTLGWMRDSRDSSLLQIAGVPGAARLVRAAPGLRIIAAHVTRGLVLSVHPDDDRLCFGTACRAIENARPAPEIAAFSNNGESAVAWFPVGHVIQIITGLPDKPAVRREFEVDGADRIAVSDDGTTVAISFGNAVYLVDPQGNRYNTAGHQLQSFIAASRDCLLTTPNAVRIWRGGSIEPETLMDGLEDVHAAALPGPSRLLVSAGAEIITADLKLQKRTSVDCGCRAAIISPLEGGSWLLNSDPSKPVWIYSDNPDGGRAFFVPARTPAAMEDKP